MTLLSATDLLAMISDQLVSPISNTIHQLVTGICSHPDKLGVVEKRANGEIKLTYSPYGSDLRVLIGKGGRTINGLKYVFREMGKAERQKAELFISQTYRGRANAGRSFKYDAAFTADMLGTVLNPILINLFGVAQWELKEEGDKMVLIFDVEPADSTLIQALNDAFYPYGFRNGRKLDFKVRRAQSVNEQ